MGRIKPQNIKRITKRLVKEHGAEFKKDFQENKEIVKRFAEIPCKKIRNSVVGYVTRIVKKTS
jgi:ribosomal protein S17E